MRHFILTSTSFTGSVEYKYCDEGYLVWFNYQATMTGTQRDKILIKMPLTIRGFEDLVALSKSLKVEEVAEDITFDAFWAAYGHKVNRQRCIPLFDKLSTENRRKCIRSVAPYLKYLARTNFRSKADPETYLRKQMYLNEWSKL